MHRIILDIGNSTTRIALMDEFTVQAMRIVPNDGIASGRDVAAVTGDLIGADTHGVQAVVCSVVPAIADLAREGLRMHAGIEVIDVDVRRVDWFEIAYETPETLGSDRLCAVIAARALYGWPAVVIDFGTATTVNVLDGAGRFLGGSISPGIGLSFRVLHTGTAQLPDVEGAPGDAEAAGAVIGRSTRESIATGVLRVARHGIAGLVREIAARIGGDVKVVVTGGHAIRYPMLAPEGAVIDAELLLKGAVEYARKAGAVKTRGAA